MKQLRLKEFIKIPITSKYVTCSDGISYDDETGTNYIRMSKGGVTEHNTTISIKDIIGNPHGEIEWWIQVDMVRKKGSVELIEYQVNGSTIDTYHYSDIKDKQAKLVFFLNANTFDIHINGSLDYEYELKGITVTQVKSKTITIPESELLLNSKFKSLTSPNNYSLRHSYSFSIPLDSESEKFFKFVDMYQDVSRYYKCEILEDYNPIANGILSLNSIKNNNLEVQFIEDINNFFDDIKSLDIKDINFDNGFIYNVNSIKPQGAIAYFNDNSEFALVHDNRFSSNYNIFDKRFMGWTYDNGYKKGVELNNYDDFTETFIGEYQPRVFARTIWDKIHKNMGVDYDGEIFDTLDWNSLLIHNNKDFLYNSDELKERKWKVKYADTNITYRHIQGGASEYRDHFILDSYGYFNYLHCGLKMSGSTTDNVITNDYGFNPNKSSYQEVTLKYDLISSFKEFMENGSSNAYFFSCAVEFDVGIRFVWTRKFILPVESALPGTQMIKVSHKIKLDNYTTGIEGDSLNYTRLTQKDKGNIVVNVPVPHDVNDNYELRIIIDIDNVIFSGNVVDDDAEIIDIVLKKIELTAKPSNIIYPDNNMMRLNKILPKWKQSDFIKDMMNLFNLKYVISENKITYYTSEEFYTSGDIINLTNKYDKNSLEQTLSNNFQSRFTKKSYADNEGSVTYTLPSNFNSTAEFKFPARVRDLSINKEGANTFIVNDLIERTENNVLFNIQKLNDKSTYLSYLNLNEFDKQVYTYEQRYFANTISNNHIHFNKINTATSIDKYSSTGDYFTIYNYAKVFEGLDNKPEFNMLSKYGKIIFDLLTNPSVKKLKGKFDINPYLYDKLNYKNIVQIDNELYLLNAINGYSSNKLTELELYTFNFNPNFNYNIDDIIYDILDIQVNPDYIFEDVSTPTGSAYVGDVHKIFISYNNLSSNLIAIQNTTVHNNTNIEFSIDNGAHWTTNGYSKSYPTPNASGILELWARANTTVTNFHDTYIVQDSTGAVVQDLTFDFDINYYTTTVVTVNVNNTVSADVLLKNKDNTTI